MNREEKIEEQIIIELYETIRLLGGESDILSIIGSFRDVSSDEYVLQEIKIYNESLKSKAMDKIVNLMDSNIKKLKDLQSANNVVDKIKAVELEQVEDIIGKEFYGEGWMDSSTINNTDYNTIEKAARLIVNLFIQ